MGPKLSAAPWLLDRKSALSSVYPAQASTPDSRPAEPRPPALSAGASARLVSPPISPPLGERRRRLTQPLCSFQALVGTFLSTILSFPLGCEWSGWVGGQRWNVLSPAPEGA